MASGNVRLPINVIGLQAFAMGQEPKLFDGKVRTDRDNAELWAVHCSVVLPGEHRPQLWAVQVAGEPKGLSAGMPVHIKDLMVTDWEMDGRQGLTFKALSVTSVANSHPAPQAAKS